MFAFFLSDCTESFFFQFLARRPVEVRCHGDRPLSTLYLHGSLHPGNDNYIWKTNLGTWNGKGKVSRKRRKMFAELFVAIAIMQIALTKFRNAKFLAESNNANFQNFFRTSHCLFCKVILFLI